MTRRIALLFLWLAHFLLLAHGLVPHHHHGEFVSVSSECEVACHNHDAGDHCSVNELPQFSSSDQHTHHSCTIEESFVAYSRTHGRHIALDADDGHFCFCALCGTHHAVPCAEGQPLRITPPTYIDKATQSSVNDISRRGPPTV